MPQKSDNMEEIKAEIKKLHEEIKKLKSELEKCEKEKEESKISRENLIEVLDETEKIVKKTFSILEGTIIGAIEGLKNNIKD